MYTELRIDYLREPMNGTSQYLIMLHLCGTTPSMCPWTQADTVIK